MKKWIGLMAIATAASSALATNLYEPFSEPVGTSLNNAISPNGQPWFQVTATGPTANITAGNMPIAGLAAPQGNALTWGSTAVAADGRGDRVDTGGYSSGQLYFSMAFQAPDVSGNATYTSGALLAGFSSSVGAGTIGTGAFKLYMERDPSNPAQYDLGITINAAGNFLASFSGALNPGQTYFLVGEWDEGGTSGNSGDTGTANLWIDPASNSFGTDNAPSPTLTYSNSDDNPGFTGYQAASFFFRQSQYMPASTMMADELRIGGTYASVTGVEWTAPASGVWSGNGNWSSGIAPGGQGADVTFGTNATGYNVTLDSAQTVGTIRFNGSNGYTIGGSATLELDTPVNGDLNIGTDTGGGASGPNDAVYIHNAANPAQVIVSSTSNVTHTISAPVYLNRSTELTVPTGSTLDLTGGVSANTETTVGVFLTLNGGGNAVITPTSSAAFTNIATGHGLTGLEVNGNLQISPAHAPILVTTQAPQLASSDGTMHQNTVTAFNLTAGSTLDLTNNDLIVDYLPSGTNTAIDTTTGPAVVADVEAAYDNGLWDKPGITTSLAPAGSGKTLAVVDNGQLTTPLTTVDGISLDSSSVAVKYTWYGDLNLDGIVDSTDIGLMGTINNSSPTNPDYPGWASGDLNYDGAVNADDWSLLFFGLAVSNGANVSPAPEPGSIIALAAAGLVIGQRRRNQIKN